MELALVEQLALEVLKLALQYAPSLVTVIEDVVSGKAPPAAPSQIHGLVSSMMSEAKASLEAAAKNP